jgi:enediyne biosynthesis thioesterase
MDQYYEYRHVVEFDETDHTGNVYAVNFGRWQGRCREMFLLERAPSVLDWLRGELTLRTVESGCECLAGIPALAEVSVRMRVEGLTVTEIGLVFDHVCTEELVARGWERVACVRGADGAGGPAPVPEALRLALGAYARGKTQRNGRRP